MRRIWSYTLVIAGVLILLYPKAGEWYGNRQQEKLLAEWEESTFDEEARQQARQQYEQLTQLFQEESAGDAAAAPASGEEAAAEPAVETGAIPSEAPAAVPGGTPSQAPSAAPVQSAPAKPAERKPSPIATISIASVKLKLPVLEGATQKNMKSAAAHLKETTALGQVGNAAIAGHRMRKKGSLFNRLGEVEIGDQIVIETKEDKYTYTVYQISVVEPTDVSVLNYNDRDKLLTLITCDPIVDPTHRLIIHAKI